MVMVLAKGCRDRKRMSMSGGSPPVLIVACANESAVQLSTQHGLFEFVLPLSHLGV